MSFVYCPECGFQNPEAANYCSKCGALLVKDEGGTETTQAFDAEEMTDDDGPLEELIAEGPALVVRSGGGRAGEHFIPQGERTTIGRSPDCDIFLDDVTVSRKHAVLIEQDGEFLIEDLGSLNGTFVNRKRIEAAVRLESGDEVQIGKYRLSFITK
ncbi:MAG TPA: FHA domain-containing protein [Gaiellaceae bacterium]